MQRWLYMLGGLLVWAVHFVGVYAIASIGNVVSAADAPTWRLGGLAFSVMCAALAAGLLVHALRRADDGTDTIDLANTLARLGALLALIAVIWQTLPTVVGCQGDLNDRPTMPRPPHTLSSGSADDI